MHAMPKLATQSESKKHRKVMAMMPKLSLFFKWQSIMALKGFRKWWLRGFRDPSVHYYKHAVRTALTQRDGLVVKATSGSRDLGRYTHIGSSPANWRDARSPPGCRQYPMSWGLSAPAWELWPNGTYFSEKPVNGCQCSFGGSCRFWTPKYFVQIKKPLHHCKKHISALTMLVVL